jgi:hypothetical protein
MLMASVLVPVPILTVRAIFVEPILNVVAALAKLKLPKRLLEADNSLFNSYNLSDGKFEEALPVKLYYEL